MRPASPQRIGLAALCASCLSPAPGKMAALFGPGAVRLALRAAAPLLLAGEPVVAVDGGNRFDPYEVGRAERALGGSGRVALSRLLVSRAFTCHQMEALLCRDLPAALARISHQPPAAAADTGMSAALRSVGLLAALSSAPPGPSVATPCSHARLHPLATDAGGKCGLARSRARVVLVLGLPELFDDGDVPYAEACRVFRRCLSALRRLSREGTRVVLAGGAPAGPGREGFFRYLERAADPLLLLGKR